MDTKLVWGTVDMLILNIVAQGDTYGYRIVQTVTSRSGGQFDLKEGSLYPALHRLERQRLLSSYWGRSPESRRRKYYRLTPTGRRELEKRRNEWSQFTTAVAGVMGSQP
jgi:transcriptional regulator